MKLLVLIILTILILPVVATYAVIEGDNWFGCSSQSDYKLLVHYLDERDLKAFNTALADVIQHMRATKYKDRESVYIEDKASGLVLLSDREKSDLTGRI